ncbi:GGDEF domain-containing protein [Shewanella khirikhana]|uniref:diguanylate cyclase n=1 Tax=Shewanella khirikhana TaxID=1965282 RepID=A0ABM7DBP3_9GAMM|nr:GGDEF domain-containing protein [Shewanella khirikhana]AZQ11247.1 putative diguanylate cyclase YedQ [Shewanella khirikhana]
MTVDESLAQIEESLRTSPETAIKELRLLDKGNLSEQQQLKYATLVGIYHIFTADYQSAQKSLEEVLPQITSTPERVKVLGYLATVRLILKQFPESMQAISDMLSQISSINDKDIQRNAYIRLASLYYQMSLFEQVGVYAEKALNLAPDDAVTDICYSYLYIAASLMEAGKITRAVSAFDETRDYCETNKLPLIATMATKGLGWTYLRDNQVKKAIGPLQQALDKYREFGFELEIASTQSLLAQAYLDAGEWDNAGAAADEAIDNAAADDTSLRGAWKVLAAVYARNGDFKGAFEAQQKEAEYSTRLIDETKAREMAYQAAKFNFEEQRREISLLNSERDGYLVRQETISREHSGSLMASTVLLGMCLFLSLFLAAGLSQRNRFMRLAQRDGLTGAFNRATGQEKGENALVRCMARGEDAAMILMDLDKFKSINDECGHATGDWALKKVVEVIRPELKSEHILCRFGGEEFMIVLPGCSGQEAAEIAEACRRAIANVDTHYSGNRFILNASFGVTSLDERDLSLDPMLRRADKSLYCAKHLGRNMVVWDQERYPPVSAGAAVSRPADEPKAQNASDSAGPAQASVPQTDPVTAEANNASATNNTTVATSGDKPTAVAN